MSKESKKESNQIVIYHNDLNKVKMPVFTELEQNLLFSILSKIRNKKANELIYIYPHELNNISRKKLTKEELKNIALSLKEKFFKADFTRTIEKKEENLIGFQTINLFTEFTIWTEITDKHIPQLAQSIMFGRKMTEYAEFKYIGLGISPKFEYLVNSLTKNFTRFEFVEFTSLKGSYTKILYRLLKQYRTQGWMQLDIKEFYYMLNIKENTKLCDIDKRILNPAITELTRERILLDYETNKSYLKIPFENLSITKIKRKGRGRGGIVTAIRFDFERQLTPKQEESINQEIEKLESAEEGCFFMEKDRNEAFLFMKYRVLYENSLLKIKHNNKEIVAKFIALSFNTDKCKDNILSLKSVNMVLKAQSQEFESEEFTSAKALSKYIDKHIINADSNTQRTNDG